MLSPRRDAARPSTRSSKPCCASRPRVVAPPRSSRQAPTWHSSLRPPSGAGAVPYIATQRRRSSGAGPPDARLVLVGEQPGDQEDLRDAPFVGPAGEVLDRALR